MRIINKTGLRKHLDEKLFAGENVYFVAKAALDDDYSGARAGILHEDDFGFYLKVLRRNNTESGSSLNLTAEIYRVKHGWSVAIPHPTYLGYYRVDLG